MPELLTGTVTFLFSDIEGSTRLLRSLGDGWEPVLARHQALLRAAFEAEGGREAGTEGDSFFVAFPTAPGAVAAAVAAQRALAAEPWPDGAILRVRIGLHTGEAGFSTDSYVGLHVHRASRIASAGHGGQVLLSDATRSLVEHALPDGVELRDLGEHRLKDLERPEHLWQLVVAGLQDEFPALASLDAVPNNLPTRLTTFLGREREMAEVEELLERSRLLTLTGPGGTGKTRLSLEIAGRSLAAYPDGVHFVELAAIFDPDLVPATIAHALGLADQGARSAVDRLIDHIGERRTLLVLDNFEQVTDAASAINALLLACPHLSVLVSSRNVLRVSGEQEYRVPPLALPDPAHLPPLAQVGQYEAVALFIERARAVKPDFAVTNENAPAVAEICVRLDGLPLAIELAAARIRIFTPQAMLTRLGDRLGLLAGGSRDLPERQQTLRGAIAWSHDMLADDERQLFARLSVFVGGASLEFIDGVSSGMAESDPIETITSLVEKSLVRQSEGIGGEPRFGMLETIREFAIEQAAQAGQWDALRERHARAYADFAHSSVANVMGPSSREWLDRFEQDHDNLRAALVWAMANDTGTALRLVHDLWRFWQRRGHLVEGLERAEAALALPDAADHPDARADGLSAAAGLSYWMANATLSRAHYEEEIVARQALGDRRGLADAHYGLSFTWSVLDLTNPATVINAERSINDALDLYRALGDEGGIARCEWALANVYWGSSGRLDEARSHAENALKLFEAIDDRFMVGWASYTVGLGVLSETLEAADPGELLAQATRRFVDALRTFAEADDVTGYTLVLDALAICALRAGDRRRAATLIVAVGVLERNSGTTLNVWNRDALRFHPQELLDDPELAGAVAVGEAMSTAEAVAYGIAGAAPEGPA